MIVTAVYYQDKGADSSDDVIKFVEDALKVIREKETHEVKRVYIDGYEDNSQLLDLIDDEINEIECVLLLAPLSDDFAKDLLNELEDTGRIIVQHYSTLNMH